MDGLLIPGYGVSRLSVSRMANALVRVFPRRTSHTPTDSMAFVGDPPLMRPLANEVHVSCTFSWDVQRAKELQQAWAQ